MSTRSLIAIENLDGTNRSIYCHYDGYPQGVGARLKNHYQTRESVEELIALGDISALFETVAKTASENSDKGEKNAASSVCKSRSELATTCAANCGAEFVYLYVFGNWLVYDRYGTKEWKILDVEQSEERDGANQAPTAEQSEQIDVQNSVVCALQMFTADLRRRAVALEDAANELKLVKGAAELAVDDMTISQALNNRLIRIESVFSDFDETLAKLESWKKCISEDYHKTYILDESEPESVNG